MIPPTQRSRPVYIIPLLALALALVATGPAHAQDSTFVDRDCTDFQTFFEAQAFYLSEGGPENDPHRLDANGDGDACEGLRGTLRRIEYGDTIVLETREEIKRVQCYGEWFTPEQLEAQSRRAVWTRMDSTQYREYWARYECLHSLGVIQDNQ